MGKASWLLIGHPQDSAKEKMAAVRAWLLMALLASICLVKENNAEDIDYGTIGKGGGEVHCGVGHKGNCRPHEAAPYHRPCEKKDQCRGDTPNTEKIVEHDGNLPKPKAGKRIKDSEQLVQLPCEFVKACTRRR